MKHCSFCVKSTTGTAVIDTVTGYVGRQAVCWDCAGVEPVVRAGSYEVSVS